MILFNVIVGVPLQVAGPAARNRADKTHAFLYQPAGQQATTPVVISGLFTDSVQVEGLLGFVREIEERRSFGLHLESEIMWIESRGGLRVVGTRRRLIEAADEAECFLALLERDAGRQVEI